MGSTRVQFGLFEFDSATRELRREGNLVRLQAQPSQVLACLIERAGQVVSREELRKTLWGGETFVDFDRGLNFCVSQIRSALQDDSAQPVYIRTVPKRGYQFIAPTSAKSRRVPAMAIVGAILLSLALVGAYFFWPRPPMVAVLRFDNETGNSGMSLFSDALSDNVVEQLTSQSGGRYRVVGNAHILRLPREMRDLKAIAASLNADYVVLGQVQSNGGQVRILAHLIRLPEQTHVWVVRADRSIADPLTVEADVARQIADQFSTRISPRKPLTP